MIFLVSHGKPAWAEGGESSSTGKVTYWLRIYYVLFCGDLSIIIIIIFTFFLIIVVCICLRPCLLVWFVFFYLPLLCLFIVFCISLLQMFCGEIQKTDKRSLFNYRSSWFSLRSPFFVFPIFTLSFFSLSLPVPSHHLLFHSPL